MTPRPQGVSVGRGSTENGHSNWTHLKRFAQPSFLKTDPHLTINQSTALDQFMHQETQIKRADAFLRKTLAVFVIGSIAIWATRRALSKNSS